MRRGCGWVDWSIFAPAAGQVIASFRNQHQRSPQIRELAALGHQWLVSAAFHHHGGYVTVLRRLGYPRPPKKPRLRRSATGRPHDGQSSKRPRLRYWTERSVQLQALREHFGSSLVWGTFPSATVVADLFPGLAAHWLRAPGGWPAAAASFHLMPWRVGRRQRIYVLAVAEAQQYYRRHHCWPTADTCSGRLRSFRYNGHHDWWSFLDRTDFHPRVLEQLLDRWKEHYAWCHRHDGAQIPEIQRVINALIIRLHKLEPFGRSSP